MKSAHEIAIGQALEVIERARTAPPEEVPELAVELAHALVAASTSATEPQERARARSLSALMDDRAGQVFATALTDRVQRTSNGARVVRAVRQLVDSLGVPRSLPHWDRLQLRALQRFGSVVPELAARAVRERIRQDAAPYIVPAEREALATFLRERARENVRVNVNHLGEQVLGKRDAERYLDAYLELLARPEVDTISVKLSSIDSAIDLTAFERTLGRLSEKLERIYLAALENMVRDPAGGEARPKLVYLDMESYRDLDLTVEVFRRVLSRPRLSGLTAGIVLQAYIPDSFRKQRELLAWAQERRAQGGAKVRLRLVKGANLMMERIEASLEGFALPIYSSKHEVDANFRRMLTFACREAHTSAVILGVGSHNLFDIALALLLRARAGVEPDVEIEMLEGMADPLRRVVQRVAGHVLVYAPSVDEADFSAAVAYLVRRLDENTSADNFLRYSFAMQPGDASFQHEAERFVAALAAARDLTDEPRRQQDRTNEREVAPRLHFDNEPNTDFSRRENREWLRERLRAGKERTFEPLLSRVGRQSYDGALQDGFDPSRPELIPYRYVNASEGAVKDAIERAAAFAPTWAKTPAEVREQVLLRVASALRRARGELIVSMVLDAGKRPLEADAEVSEAIDFAEYYAHQHRRLRQRFELSAKGVVVVTPPWNFPLAIGLGAALAALVAGNAVLVKPSPETPLVLGLALARCWEAGAPAEALGLVIADDEAATPLVVDARVSMVLLTGGSDTARLFRRLRPDIDLGAETGGKNATIVSALSDREQAIQHAVRSAFSHAGQKCSATSLLILEREVYRSATFRRQLADATESLPIGSAWDAENVVTPLIRPPSGALLRALGVPRAGESFLVTPRRSPDNPRLVGPALVSGVTRDSPLYDTELFGPLLSVMEAEDLPHAIELANGVSYGLTAGLESLDEQEQRLFIERMQAGNLYVNRPTTGAIVGRQPFGGRKASSFGAGHKAGGPNFLLGLTHVERELSAPTTSWPLSAGPRRPSGASPKQTRERTPLGSFAPLVGEYLRSDDAEQSRVLGRRIASYERAYREELSSEHAQDQVLGHRDSFGYLPAKVLLVAGRAARDFDLVATLVACELCGVEPTLFAHEALAGRVYERLAGRLARYGSSEPLALELAARGYDRLRLIGATSEELALDPSIVPPGLSAEPVSDAGYVELRRYLLERSISVAHHRYGNVGLRGEAPGV